MSEEFDVFLSHNSRDKPEVERIGLWLKGRGLRPWLDKLELRPGFSWQKGLEEGIAKSRGVAVFVGADGLGPWEEPEMEVFLDRSRRDKKMPVIPVLLPGAPKEVELPLFLKLNAWVDLREGVTDEGLERLVWGITGKKPGAGPLYSQVPDSGSRQELVDSGGGKITSSTSGYPNKRRRPRWLDWSIALGILGVVATVVAWLYPPPPQRQEPAYPALYSLRVQVLDPAGQPTPASAVRVTAGHEPQKLQDGWWEVEISSAKLPQDRKITVWVESEAWDAGRADLQLDTDPNPSVEVRLAEPTSFLEGRVQDSDGHPLAGAKVWPQNVPGPAAVTGPEGRFRLELTVKEETRVLVRADFPGSPAAENYCYAGRSHCPLEVSR